MRVIPLGTYCMGFSPDPGFKTEFRSSPADKYRIWILKAAKVSPASSQRWDYDFN